MYLITRNWEALSGLFPANLPNSFGLIARYAPSGIDQISAKIDRPCLNIFCGKGSYANAKKNKKEFYVTDIQKDHRSARRP